MKTGYLVVKRTDNMRFDNLDEPLMCFEKREDAIEFIKNYDDLRDQEFVVGYSSQNVDDFTKEEMRITDIEEDLFDEENETRRVIGNGDEIKCGTRIRLYIVEIPCA